jgi:hypothetical protein
MECFINLSMVSRGRGVGRGRGVYWGSMSISSLGLWWVDSGTLIGHLSNKSIVVVSSVGGGLDSAIRKSNGERSSNFALSILSLSLSEAILRVVISYSIFIGIWLRGKLLLLVRSWGICWGRVVGGRGTIGRGASSRSSGKEGRGNQELEENIINKLKNKIFISFIKTCKSFLLTA